ncbi:MAG TPA: hypothetical protein VH161_00270 [Candidatus Acidoferrales bacterium]|jgi:hypothetical protein|nr:hypothetical protein [Candidatus Acidoferrales bacterium]
MPTITNAKESKHSLVDSVAYVASFLPGVLEFVGLPKSVSRTVEHALRLVPALRKGAANDGHDAFRDAVSSRFVSVLEDQQRLSARCDALEVENAKIRGDLAGAADQVQLLKADTQALRTELDSLRTRNLYLSIGALAAFLLALAALTVRFIK